MAERYFIVFKALLNTPALNLYGNWPRKMQDRNYYPHVCSREVSERLETCPKSAGQEAGGRVKAGVFVREGPLLHRAAF